MTLVELRYLLGADGVRLAVRAAGDPQAPPIVLVHGWASAGSVWAGQLADPTLTARHRLVAVDLRGHGESETPDPAEGGYDEPADVGGRPRRGAGPRRPARGARRLVLRRPRHHRLPAGTRHGRASPASCWSAPSPRSARGRPGGRTGASWHGVMRPALSEDPDAGDARADLAGDRDDGRARGRRATSSAGSATCCGCRPRCVRHSFGGDLGGAEVLASVSRADAGRARRRGHRCRPEHIGVRGREDSGGRSALVPKAWGTCRSSNGVRSSTRP